MPEYEGTLAELGVTAVGPAGLQTVTLNLRHLGTQGCHRPRTLLVRARDRDRETHSHLLPLPPQLGGGQLLGGGLQFTLAFATGLSLLYSSSSLRFIIYFHHL